MGVIFMYADLIISGLDKTEQAVREILAHVEAIKKEVDKLGLRPVAVSVELKSDAASGN